MLKNTRRSLLAGGALILTGLVLFAVVMTVNGWDFEKLSTVDYETSTYKITEEFKNIRVNTYESDVLLLPSGDDECRIVIREDKKLKHAFSVTEDTLTIEPAGKRKWYDHIAVIPDSGRITLYLPETEYAYLNIRTDTGDIVVPADFRFSNSCSRYRSSCSHLGQVPVQSPLCLHSAVTKVMWFCCAICCRISFRILHFSLPFMIKPPFLLPLV